MTELAIDATPYASLILPFHNQSDHIARVVNGFLADFAKLERRVELVLVPNGCTDASAEICHQLGAAHADHVQVVELERGGWGRAINAGLAVARGEIVGYTNTARTSPETATLMLAYAIAYPDTVLKASRRVRENALRRAGSVLYNFECRRLFDINTWDIDGTPKLFPRSFQYLMRLESEGELYDLELLRACRYAGYPIVEIPIYPVERLGGRSTTNIKSAARMLWGAYRMNDALAETAARRARAPAAPGAVTDLGRIAH